MDGGAPPGPESLCAKGKPAPPGGGGGTPKGGPGGLVAGGGLGGEAGEGFLPPDSFAAKKAGKPEGSSRVGDEGGESSPPPSPAHGMDLA